MNQLDLLRRAAIPGSVNRRQFLHRISALGVGAVAANSLMTGATFAQNPQRGGILKAGMQGGAGTDSLDPALWSSLVPWFFGRHWGEQLLEIGPDGKLMPGLAEEWDASADAKVWTFKIRTGVEFHNGKSLTPEDVAATFERHSDAATKSGALGILGGLEGIRVDGPNVVFTLKEPNADFPFLMDDYHLMVQPNGGKDDPTAGIGTGPYKIAVNTPGVRHGGERFENYWRDDRGFADQIEVLVINDATARIAAVQSGQVDVINRVDPKVVSLIKRAPGVTVRNSPGKGHYVFVMHCDTAPFDNNDLRLALKYAVNRDEMLEKVLFGYGSVGNDTPINAQYPLYTAMEQRTYDPDKARFHLKKSGHSGPILMRTSDVAFPGALEATQLYQQSAAACGIQLDIRREPGDGYWSEIWNKQPFCASYWSGRPTQDLMYSTTYFSKAAWNDTRYVDPEFDKMLVSARGELDEARRRQIYADMAMKLNENGGVITPMFGDFIDATGPKISGWVPNGNYPTMGGYALSKCWVAG